MLWDDSRYAGFTTGSPWLPLGDDHASANVEALEKDRRSILHLYRKLIDLRQCHQALVSGTLRSVSAENGVLRYQRQGEEEHILVLLNMGQDPERITIESGSVLVSTYLDREGQKVSGTVDLEVAEGIVIGLDM
jgi:alpha-glucosidase